MTDLYNGVVISTEAQRNGEIYLTRFCFAGRFGFRLHCTPPHLGFQ
jgi:hypothetical protein